MHGSATCKHSGIRARSLGGLGNRGSRQQTSQAKSAAAPPSPPRLLDSLRFPPAGQDPTAGSVQIPEGAQRVAAGKAGSRAPPPLLRCWGLVQPARFRAEKVGWSSQLGRQRLPDSCEPSGSASRWKGRQRRPRYLGGRLRGGCSSSPLCPGQPGRAGASCLLAPWQPRVCELLAYVCEHMELLGGPTGDCAPGRGTAGSPTPVPRPGLALDPFPQIILLLRTLRGSGGGPGEGGTEIRKGPQGHFGHIQPVRFTDEEAEAQSGEVTGPESQV